MTDNKQVLIFAGKQERLDIFTANSVDGYSRGIIQRMIKDERITVNSKLKKASWLLEEGDIIEIAWPKKAAKTNLADIIIYEDKNFFVINKPDGLLVHPQSPAWEETPEAVFTAEETLASMILANPPAGFEVKMPRAGLVHRLDRETSGIMMVAKTEEFQTQMIELFGTRQVDKTYNAICCGEVKDDKGTIDVPIGRQTGGKIKASNIGRPAITVYKVLERKNGFSYMELSPKTGRTNQLRVHMSWLGYPVLGDWLYKGATSNRLMLHARKLEFKNPANNRKVKFEMLPPHDFDAAWQTVTKSK